MLTQFEVFIFMGIIYLMKKFIYIYIYIFFFLRKIHLDSINLR